MKRRSLILGAGVLFGASAPVLTLMARGGVVVSDKAGINRTLVKQVLKPTSVGELQAIVKASTLPISIAGAGYSQGGHILSKDSLHVDTRGLNQVLELDTDTKIVRVQAGITWIELQQQIDQHDLSVMIMQSFSNFTVGGSLSVNCHGRYVNRGAIVNSVISISVLLADGAIVNASRTENAKLFAAVIGGYGGIGIITEATLQLVDNICIARQVEEIQLSDYVDYFANIVASDDKMVMHNADLMPPSFDAPLVINYRQTDKQPTDASSLYEHGQNHVLNHMGFWLEDKLGKGQLRKLIYNPMLENPKRVMLNHEASLDLTLLAKNQTDYVYALQEYFIPADQLVDFVDQMREVFINHDANVLNVSIRQAKHDDVSILSWAQTDVFCFVIYYGQSLDQEAIEATRVWTQKLIDTALAKQGCFYLPYYPYATQDQLEQAYPSLLTYKTIKKVLDPDNRFTNQFWEHYLD